MYVDSGLSRVLYGCTVGCTTTPGLYNPEEKKILLKIFLVTFQSKIQLFCKIFGFSKKKIFENFFRKKTKIGRKTGMLPSRLFAILSIVPWQCHDFANHLFIDFTMTLSWFCKIFKVFIEKKVANLEHNQKYSSLNLDRRSFDYNSQEM